MKLSNTKIQYNENGSFVDIQKLVSCDVDHSTSGNRSNWKRSGTYENSTLAIDLNYLRGYNTLLDSIAKNKEIELRWNDGAIIYQGIFLVDNKFNTKTEDGTNTYMSLLFLPKTLDGEDNYLKKTSTAQGAKSGVQDVQIEGKSIVDEDTGIANITTLATKETTDQLENYCDALDATKQEAINYITVSGSSGTLTEAQIETLKSGNPRLNFISRLNILLKCVYVIDTKGVYAAAGESKIHVIDASFKTGNWTYKIYSMQPTLTAGTNITIKDNVISATGGGEPSQYLKSITKSSEGVVTITDKDGNETVFQTGGGSGGVSQDYVDTQDQNVKNYADDQDQKVIDEFDEKIKTEASERANMDATLTEGLLQESDTRTQADSTLSTRIDDEVVARTSVDIKLQNNIDNLELNKQDKLIAGTNITISENNVISATGGSGGSYVTTSGTSGKFTTEQLALLRDSYDNYILHSTTRHKYYFCKYPSIAPGMLTYMAIDQNKINIMEISPNTGGWTITEGSELATQDEVAAVDAKLGEDENGIYVDL